MKEMVLKRNLWHKSSFLSTGKKFNGHFIQEIYANFTTGKGSLVFFGISNFIA